MIPSLTGYGFDVLRAVGTTGAVTTATTGPADHTGSAAPATPVVTTGHAATVVSVVRTVHAALDATGQQLGALTVAFVGLGSIGSSSLELLLTRAQQPPARLLLCDVPGSGPRLKELAENLLERGLVKSVEVVESDQGLPGAVYDARLIVAAVSGGGALLDIDRLAPGTTVVDDSFPHCFDTSRAIGRMDRAKDVLVVGGGLLSAGTTERRVAEGSRPPRRPDTSHSRWCRTPSRPVGWSPCSTPRGPMCRSSADRSTRPPDWPTGKRRRRPASAPHPAPAHPHHRPGHVHATPLEFMTLSCTECRGRAGAGRVPGRHGLSTALSVVGIKFVLVPPRWRGRPLSHAWELARCRSGRNRVRRG